MTLSSWFGSASPGIVPVPADRGDISHSHSHGWKGESALSALTLLAFLFFLNILQNCLRETMPTQAPTVMVMMMDTTTAAPCRAKRDDAGGERLKGDTGYWSDDQMSELVSNHVHSYWTERQGRTPNRANVISTKLHVQQPPHFHRWTDTDVNVTERHEDADTTEWYRPLHNDVEQEPDYTLKQKRQDLLQPNGFHPELSFRKTKKHRDTNYSGSMASNWWKVIDVFVAFVRPTARRLVCCDFLDCHSQRLERSARKSQKDITHLLRRGVLWLCGGSAGYHAGACSAETLCTNQLARTIIASVFAVIEPLASHGSSETNT